MLARFKTGPCVTGSSTPADSNHLFQVLPFQTRLSEGVVRCYMVGDRCAGFGHQKVKALVDSPAARAEAGRRLYSAAMSVVSRSTIAVVERRETY